VTEALAGAAKGGGDAKAQCENRVQRQNLVAGFKDTACAGNTEFFPGAESEANAAVQTSCCSYIKSAGEAKFQEATNEYGSPVIPDSREQCRIFKEKRAELLADALWSKCSSASEQASAYGQLDNQLCNIEESDCQDDDNWVRATACGGLAKVLV